MVDTFAPTHIGSVIKVTSTERDADQPPYDRVSFDGELEGAMVGVLQSYTVGREETTFRFQGDDAIRVFSDAYRTSVIEEIAANPLVWAVTEFGYMLENLTNNFQRMTSR